MKFLKDAIAPAYLGLAVGLFANVHWNQWQFYAITVPFFVLAKITGFNKEDNENN